MPAPPVADFVVLTSRLSPHRDGGYAVAVAARLRLLRSIGVERPLLLTFDVGDADEHEKENRQAFHGDPRPDVDIRNLFDEIRRDPTWLYARARDGRADPAAAYRPIRDDDGREVVSLPVLPGDPSWHLTETAVVVRGPGGDRTIAGFGALYLAWLRRVVAQLRARADDDQRCVVVICESKQLGELIAHWDDPNVRIVHTVHNSHLTVPCGPSSSLRDDGWRRWLDLLPRFDAVIWPTASQQADVAGRFRAHEGSVAIPTPVDPDPRSRSHRPRGRSVVMVNRLVDQKRVDAAISAWPLVLQRVPDAHLDIYGDGPLGASLQELIDAHGLTRSVHLHGYSDRIPEALADATAFLCTSSFEGQNLAIGEALASGLPVVAFDVCYGPRDYVGDGGILVPFGDIEGVATALTTLLEDEEARAVMSERAFRRSLRLRPEAVGNAFAHVLAEVAARPARRGAPRRIGAGAGCR
jgi:glycosyltransferase involved in cell wall biosynthesis